VTHYMHWEKPDFATANYWEVDYTYTLGVLDVQHFLMLRVKLLGSMTVLKQKYLPIWFGEKTLVGLFKCSFNIYIHACITVFCISLLIAFVLKHWLQIVVYRVGFPTYFSTVLVISDLQIKRKCNTNLRVPAVFVRLG